MAGSDFRTGRGCWSPWPSDFPSWTRVSQHSAVRNGIQICLCGKASIARCPNKTRNLAVCHHVHISTLFGDETHNVTNESLLFEQKLVHVMAGKLLFDLDVWHPRCLLRLHVEQTSIGQESGLNP